MGKARGVDGKLARLRVLRDEPGSAAVAEEIRSFLDDKSNFVVAAAAEIAGAQRFNEVAPRLVASFHRFLIDATESDKICKATIAIVEALDKLEYDREDIFRVALNHVQLEPRWHPPGLWLFFWVQRSRGCYNRSPLRGYIVTHFSWRMGSNLE